MSTATDRLELLLRLDPDKHDPEAWKTLGRRLTPAERQTLSSCTPDDFHMAIELLSVNITKDAHDVVGLGWGYHGGRPGANSPRVKRSLGADQDANTADLVHIVPRIAALRAALERIDPATHRNLFGRGRHKKHGGDK